MKCVACIRREAEIEDCCKECFPKVNRMRNIWKDKNIEDRNCKSEYKKLGFESMDEWEKALKSQIDDHEDSLWYNIECFFKEKFALVEKGEEDGKV